jgi:signal transduction histidine kinase
MASNYTHKKALWFLVAQVLCASAATYLYIQGAWIYGTLVLLALLLLVMGLLQLINSTHRRLRFFFEAVKNEDGSLHFPETVKDKHLQGLHKELNRLNGLMSDLRVQQAHSERFFMEFMKRSASGLIAVDAEGFVEIVNDAALRLINLPNLTHLDRLQQHNPALYALMDSLKPGQSESIKIPQGKLLRQIAVKEARIRFLEKEYRLFSLYDIKHELEEQELDTWQKLIRIMTHEIMNSIAPITSLSQTLSSFFTQDGRVVTLERLEQRELDNTVEGLSVIAERAQGLLSFVDNYRKLSQLPQPEFKTIDLSKWLKTISLLFEPQRAEHEIKLEVINRFKGQGFPGDEKLLTHVVLNLLNNAVAALGSRNQKSVALVAQETPAGGLHLTVKDNGCGFQEEERDKIFLPFYTTKQNGSGIGLSLSRQIMRMHRGTISASSVVGEGSSFVLEL